MVDHLIPKTLHEALSAMERVHFIKVAGGTDLMVQRRMGPMVEPRFESPVIFLYHLKELNYVKEEDHQLIIGSMTPMEDLLHHPSIPDHFKKVLNDIASPGIRQMATLAGNLANASPAADTLVYLYASRAEILLASLHHERIVPIRDFITGVKKTVLKDNELIKEIHVPLCPCTTFTWTKVGGRKSDAISKVSFVGMAEMSDHHLIKIGIALGAVAPMVICDHAMEDDLQGLSIKELCMRKDAIIKHYASQINPIDDQRSNKAYRRKVAMNLLTQFLDELLLKGMTS